MLYKGIGLLTGVGTLMFLAVVLLGITAQVKVAPFILVFALGAIAAGLLTMIWHVNMVQRSAEIKDEWRNHLTYFGPLAAAAYLWRVEHKPGQAATFAPQQGKIMAAVILSVAACLITWTVNSRVPAMESLVTSGEILLNYVLRSGAVVSTAVFGTVLRLRFWPWIALMILPSLIAIYVVAVGDLEIRGALLVAAFFVAWVMSNLMQRVLSKEV